MPTTAPIRTPIPAPPTHQPIRAPTPMHKTSTPRRRPPAPAGSNEDGEAACICRARIPEVRGELVTHRSPAGMRFPPYFVALQATRLQDNPVAAFRLRALAQRIVCRTPPLVRVAHL